MSSHTYRFPLIKHYYLLCVHDGGDALGDYEYSRFARIFFKRATKRGVCFKVKRGEAVVENINRRLLRESAGN